MKIFSLKSRIGLIIVSTVLILLIFIQLSNYIVYLDELKQKVPILESKIIEYQNQVEFNNTDITITTEIQGNTIRIPAVMYVYMDDIIYDIANSDIYYNQLYMEYELVSNHLENMSFWEYCKYSYRMNL